MYDLIQYTLLLDWLRMWPLLWFPIDEEECDLGLVFIYFTNIYKEPLKKKSEWSGGTRGCYLRGESAKALESPTWETREPTMCGDKKRIWGGRNSKCSEQKGVQHIWGPERGPGWLEQSVWGSQEEHEPGRGRPRGPRWQCGARTQGSDGNSILWLSYLHQVIEATARRLFKGKRHKKKGGSMIAFRWAARGSKESGKAKGRRCLKKETGAHSG